MSRIGLLSADCDVAVSLRLRMENRGHQVITLGEPAAVLGYLYSDPPDLLIVDLVQPPDGAHAVLREIKADSYFSMMPVVALVPFARLGGNDFAATPVDDFITWPVSYPELFSRIALALQRIQRVLDNNPLTRLPGNTSIQLAIEGALGKPMAVCYLDINHFKPFNDTYGFTRGDEVIRMTGRIIANAVKQASDSGFRGHIGGDDFVFIVPRDAAESVCETIIANFEFIASDLFGEKEKAAGFYLATTRAGEAARIPLLSIAIAVVPLAGGHIAHPGKVAETASELKNQAKKSGHSSYLVDRRTHSGDGNHARSTPPSARAGGTG